MIDAHQRLIVWIRDFGHLKQPQFIADLEAVLAENQRLREVLTKCRSSHLYIEEDPYYSCRSTFDADDDRYGPCDCGADQVNAMIDEVIEKGEPQ